MALTINGAKPPSKKKAAGNDYSEHLGPQLKAKAGKGTLQITKKQNKTGEESTLADVVEPVGNKQLIPADQLASISVGGAQTINTGNYESIKITVQLTIPSGIHDIDASYEFASDWVSKKMEEAITQVKG